jgi:thioesterase domain-containing protein/acyl carrier protein
MQATPATWRLLLEAGWQGHEKLRMLCGGEAMSRALAEQLVRCGSELWNMYGPTETTVWSSVRRIPRGFERIDIGKPIDRTQFYILDTERNIVPAGQVGELFIGGSGLARGYRGRPDLTCDRFIPNPHRPPGDRIYRTGDLGRMLGDGSFDCLGRIDHQVKIRGYRIELGEIEAVLRQVADVREVVVIAEDRDGEPRLVAYWVGGAQRQALIDAARRLLPPYMVPSSYVLLEALPLTPNGKIDRKSLPRAEAMEQDVSTLARPANDVETGVAAVWAAVLGLNQIGVDQDFFSLGGTSVLAIEVCARIDKEMGIEIPLASFFESPTVESLARYVARAPEVSSQDSPIVVELRRGAAGREPLFCLMGVHLYQDLALALTDDRPVIGMHLPFRYLPASDRRPTVPEMAAGYLKLIRRRQAHGPYHLAGLCFGGIVAFEAARQLEAVGEEVALVVVFDGMLPSAVHINQVRRLTSYLRTAVRDPRRLGALLSRNLRGVLARRGWLGRALPAPPGAEAPSTVPIDVEIVGADADAEVERYASGLTAISARLLSVRALTQDLTAGMELAPHLGWEGLSPRLVIGDVAATHLGLLREPHVRDVARMITDALKKEASSVDQDRRRTAASG